MFVKLFRTANIHEANRTHSKIRYRNNYVLQKKKTKCSTVIEKARHYLIHFLETSSIHGLNHLVTARRHPVEVFLWTITVTLSVYGSVSLSGITWTRYQSSPTVISMDRDMFAWNTTFPGVTICLLKKLDDVLLKNYLETSKEPDKEKLKNFIMSLANATFETFENVTDYDGIPPEQYTDLLVNLSVPFKGTLTIGAAGVTLNIVPTITEMGVCRSINSKVAVYNSPSYRKADRWDHIAYKNKSFVIHPLDGEMFAQFTNLSTAFQAFIHSPYEVADISMQSKTSEEGSYMKLYVTALTVYTSKEAAQLSVAQRKCRFLEENNLRHNAVYTYNMCRIECRIRLCLKYCHCIPHFYRRIGNEKICDPSGLRCLADYKDLLYKLRDKNDRKVECNCYPNCDDVNYVLQSFVLQPWFLGTNLQWGIGTYPRMRYRRDIIFGFTDVLVAVGSMAGLFLGCSVLSFMEIVYFLTLRLFCYIHEQVKNK